MEQGLARYFNRDMIVWGRTTPQIFGTRIGFIDLVPGPYLRHWIVFEHETNPDGSPGRCDLKGHILLPVHTAMIGRAHVNAKLVEMGLVTPDLVAAQIVRPAGIRLM